jgi:hypothetical protein
MAKSRKGASELLNDYYMLDKMSRELQKHSKNVKTIGKRVVRQVWKTDLKEGLVENLEIVSNHMKRAQKELDSAKKKLKMI